MYRGKHSKPVKKQNKPLILLASLVLILMVTTGGTLAVLITNDGPLQNIFNPTEVSSAVVEKGADGSSDFDNAVKTNVRIQNTGNIDAYLRASITVNWKNEAGKILGTPVNTGDFRLTLSDSEKWCLGSDGFLYYTEPVAPGDLTEILISELVPLAEAPAAGYYLSADILCSAVQADGTTQTETLYPGVPEGTPPVVAAWGSYAGGSVKTVNSDGILEIQAPPLIM